MDDLTVAMNGLRDKLKRCIRFRLDARLRSRLDESDVVQEVYLEAYRRYADYSNQAAVPIYAWLRTLALQRVSQLHRIHFGTQSRNAALEQGCDSETSSLLVSHLLADNNCPSQNVIHSEMTAAVQKALAQMDPIDREVIVLRHFEMLSNDEIAEVTGLTKAGASNRYIRAIRRLRDAMNMET